MKAVVEVEVEGVLGDDIVEAENKNGSMVASSLFISCARVGTFLFH